MYKCSECGLEFEIKPDYCECGNDVFEEIKIETIPPKEKTVKQTQKTVKSVDSDNNIQETKDFSKRLNTIKKFKSNPLDIGSVLIFSVCIILSFIIIFFVRNPKENQITDTQAVKTYSEKNIPSADAFWDNSVPAITAKQQSEIKNDDSELKQNEIKEVKQIPQTTAAKLTKNITAQKVSVQKNTTPKTVTKENKTTAKQKQTITKNSAQTTATKTAAAKPTLTKQEAPAINTAEKSQQQTVIQNQSKQEQETQTTVPVKDTAASQREYLNYKTGLQNTIGSKIDFTKVVGDGDCTVAFRIDSTGKLTNRSFSKQSSNITLNDAVYKAVMLTPAYNPPPSGYNNEILNLNIKFYNGNFEIYIK